MNRQVQAPKLDIKWVISKLPPRPKDANKGTFGKVLVIAGSENFPGAAYLACAASYRVGTGLVTLAAIPSVKIVIAKKLPEVTFISQNEVGKKLMEYDAVLMGPGLGQQNYTKALIKRILKHKLHKLVLDADALNTSYKPYAVLTPHPGEMARLTGLTVNEIQSDRENVAKHFAKKWRKIVVLKGADTIIASPDGECAVNPFANPLLATAGTGDVLAGIIAGLLAQGLNEFEGACAGVFIHSMAGEMLKEKLGDAGALASDLLPLIPKTLLNISKHRVS